MPDYNLSSPDRVQVSIPGNILDENYSRLLMERSDLNLCLLYQILSITIPCLFSDSLSKGYGKFTTSVSFNISRAYRIPHELSINNTKLEQLG